MDALNIISLGLAVSCTLGGIYVYVQDKRSMKILQEKASRSKANIFED